MQEVHVIAILLLQLLISIFGKDCYTSPDDATSLICSENPPNFTYYLSEFTNITQLSLIQTSLMEMPAIDDKNRLTNLYLDRNQIQFITQNYSTIEYLSLASNHIYALHQTNLSYPKLQLLDLSHNPIEYIIENFFTEQQFPQLKVLKLTHALDHIKPSLIDNRVISFASLKYLNEITLDENALEEFSCSKNTTHIQWRLPLNLKKISFGTNQLVLFDEGCFSQLSNSADLDFQHNNLRNFSNLNVIFPYLLKLQLNNNSLIDIPSNFLHSTKQLTELDLSANPLNFEEIQQNPFPTTLRILYLNSMKTNLVCSLFENLSELEQLHLMELPSTELDDCLFTNLTKLKILNLRYHHLQTFSEHVFRPLLTSNQLQKLDITSNSLLCDSCSLRWLINFLKHHNQMQVTCLDQQGNNVLLNTLSLSACSSLHIFSTVAIIILTSIALLLFIMIFIFLYQHRKLSFTKLAPVYHMVSLRHYDRIHQNTTDDLTNDNVMLVT